MKMTINHRTHETEPADENRTYIRDVYSCGGYEVTVDQTVFADKARKPMIFVSVRYEGTNDYAADIYFRDNRRNEKAAEFVVQTTAYGALAADEFEKFVEAQQEGLAVARYLNDHLDELTSAAAEDDAAMTAEQKEQLFTENYIAEMSEDEHIGDNTYGAGIWYSICRMGLAEEYMAWAVTKEPILNEDGNWEIVEREE